MPETLHETISKSKLNICNWPVCNCVYCGTQKKYTLDLGQQYLIAVRDKKTQQKPKPNQPNKKKTLYHLTQPKTLILCNVLL